MPRRSNPRNRRDPPVNLVVPNVIEEKMKAICNVAKAVEQVALALNSVNVQATISNNIISNVGQGISLSLKSKETV